jgi:oxazoline/thiazoline synthase
MPIPRPEEPSVVELQSPSPVDVEAAPPSQEYTLSPHVDVLVCGEDEVRIRQGTWSDRTLTLYDDERHGVLGRVFTELLLGGRTVDELGAAVAGPVVPADLVRLFDDLAAAGVLVPPGVQARPGPFARHPALGGEATPAVAVAGDGPTADLLHGYLSDAGVATGRAASLDRPGPPRAALEAAWGAGDLLVVALERFSPATLDAANALALARRRPWVATYSDGPLVVVGPIYVPGETGCWAELETQMLAVCPRRAERQGFWDVLDARTAPRTAPRWHGGLAAGWLMGPLLTFLDTGGAGLVGRAVVVDTGEGRVEHVRCLALPRCPVCRPDPGDHHPWD